MAVRLYRCTRRREVMDAVVGALEERLAAAEKQARCEYKQFVAAQQAFIEMAKKNEALRERVQMMMQEEQRMDHLPPEDRLDYLRARLFDLLTDTYTEPASDTVPERGEDNDKTQ
jgi:hypothetical protein